MSSFWSSLPSSSFGVQQRVVVVVVVVDVKAEDDTDYGVDFGARRSFALLLFGSIMTTSFCHTVILWIGRAHV